MSHFDRFGPYHVHEQLGAGGMATVHRATIAIAKGVRREVALKRMLPGLAADQRFVDHLIHEAKLASTLRHPNIVQIYELGRIERTYFIAMELVYGVPLLGLMRRAHLAKTPTPIPIVLSLLDELCDALDYASNGMDSYGEPLRIVHRDLSPTNLLITDDGHLKLIDFGVAKAVAGGRFRTSSGEIKGKLGYMSIEAIDNDPIDCRADIFSAGVIAWELLAGRRLFRGATADDTAMMVRDAEIRPPSEDNPSCPAALDAVVLRALARDRDDRWPTAAAFRDALAPIRRDHRRGGTPREIAAWVGADLQRSPAEDFDAATEPTGSAIQIGVAELGPLEEMLLESEDISRQLYIGPIDETSKQTHIRVPDDPSKEIVIAQSRTRTRPGVRAPTPLPDDDRTGRRAAVPGRRPRKP